MSEVKVVAMEVNISFLEYNDEGKVNATSNGRVVVLESEFDKTFASVAEEAKRDFIKQRKENSG